MMALWMVMIALFGHVMTVLLCLAAGYALYFLICEVFYQVLNGDRGEQKW
jgi:hypothetical protein